MPIDRSVDEHLYRIFTENFTVRDIAEGLVSFDATASAGEVKRLMGDRHFKIVGIREQGIVTGYVRYDELAQGVCGDFLHRIDAAGVLDEEATFVSVINVLGDRPYAFVTSFGRIAGIVSRTDLQKAPVRMWLFGMITIIEMTLRRLVESHFPDDGWKELLSAGRLEKAEQLLAERQRRNQDLGLLECLQFSDKGQIVVKDKQIREKLGFESRRAGEDMIKKLEALRNGLAHSQDVISCEWETIVRLAENIQGILALPALHR